MHNNRRVTKRGIFPTAGWLFADLLLALTVIFIAASAIGKPTPKAAFTPTPTWTPIPMMITPTQIPQALDPNPLKFTVNVDPFQLGNSNTISDVKNKVMQKLDQSNDSDRKAGFVITLAGGISGVDHAMAFNAILKSMPSFQSTLFKNYHDLGNPENEFDLEIYFFT